MYSVKNIFSTQVLEYTYMFWPHWFWIYIYIYMVHTICSCPSTMVHTTTCTTQFSFNVQGIYSPALDWDEGIQNIQKSILLQLPVCSLYCMHCAPNANATTVRSETQYSKAESSVSANDNLSSIDSPSRARCGDLYACSVAAGWREQWASVQLQQCSRLMCCSKYQQPPKKPGWIPWKI
jgi:hypothetical protein